jgi:VIT1/CCC1 family predicted Fe2+/Mn2+ transporter
MEQLSSFRGIDFVQARRQVIESIKRAIKSQDDQSSQSLSALIQHNDFNMTLLSVPGVCCLLLTISLIFTPTPFHAGLLVSLFAIIAVVVLNLYLYQVVSSAESNEIKRELERILDDFEEFSNYSAITSIEGAMKTLLTKVITHHQ